jgi:peptidoglycan hydrolase-like protein with peptidoglycan-binding domain
VVYYSSRSLVPSRYLERDVYRSDSLDVAVQRALARLGYYRGPIDGDIGPGSRSAIARYQRDHGFAVTGTINSTLLRALGIR